MVLFGVKNRETGKDVDFASNPVNLFPTSEAASKALASKNSKAKEGDSKIDGVVVPYTVHQPVIASRPR